MSSLLRMILDQKCWSRRNQDLIIETVKRINLPRGDMYIFGRNLKLTFHWYFTTFTFLTGDDWNITVLKQNFATWRALRNPLSDIYVLVCDFLFCFFLLSVVFTRETMTIMLFVCMVQTNSSFKWFCRDAYFMCCHVGQTDQIHIEFKAKFNGIF